MKIRSANKEDSNEIFNWRNNIDSIVMSLNNRKISLAEHNKWFEDSVNNLNREIFIGEKEGVRLGLCRFDYNKKLNLAKVSINMNPSYRSKGFGKELLENTIQYYLNKNNCILKAQIKSNNIISKKLFLSVGFYITEVKNEIIEMEFINKFRFKKIQKSDVQILYELLKKREHNISHKNLPNFNVHKDFVESKPYLHWYKISLGEQVIGTFYIKADNSIGINLTVTNKYIVTIIIDYILTNFTPQEEIPSQIPNYFYLNISETNNKLKNIIQSLGYIQFQVSYKLKD